MQSAANEMSDTTSRTAPADERAQAEQKQVPDIIERLKQRREANARLGWVGGAGPDAVELVRQSREQRTAELERAAFGRES